MADARRKGTDFNELCSKYASEEAKANYEDPENDFSLSEGRYRSSIPSLAAEWLYEDGRKSGDITVIEDADSNRYYVVEFINRYFDEEDNARISNVIASDIVAEYRNGLVENYQVIDTKGNLNYLTIPVEDISSDEDASSNEDASSDDNGSSDTEE